MSSSRSQKPSRRSPRSTIRITLWRTPARAAASLVARSTEISLCRLISAHSTSSSTSVGMGMRIIISGVRMPACRRVRSCSRREEPMLSSPARS